MKKFDTLIKYLNYNNKLNSYKIVTNGHVYYMSISNFNLIEYYGNYYHHYINNRKITNDIIKLEIIEALKLILKKGINE